MPTDTLLKDKFNLKKTQVDGLERLNIETIRDLLYHFPSRFYSSHEKDGTELKKGEDVLIKGSIKSIRMRRSMGKRRVMMTEALIQTDERKSVKALWFNQPYLAKKFKDGDFVEIAGKVSGTKSTYISNSEIKAISNPLEKLSFQGEDNENLSATYPESKGISSLWIRTTIEKILKDKSIDEEDIIPKEIRENLNLPNWKDAISFIHRPKRKDNFEVAKKRFSFEEIFFIQLSRQKFNQDRLKQKSYKLVTDRKKVDKFINERFSFKPTKSQIKVIGDVLGDLGKAKPMFRLLEGDVGSGKTAVAAAIMYAAVSTKIPDKDFGSLQVSYMAPTEILAKQQFETIISLFSHLPISIGLITSGGCKKFPSKIEEDSSTKISKSQLIKWTEAGTISIIVGTHALIQKSIKFKRMALAIIDEQHRFGISQRKKLLEESSITPHLLSMTATPIPRTLALTIYGDLDLSVIDELPEGRKPVRTKVLEQKNKDKAYEHIREEIKKGRQAYVICPRIEEGVDERLTSVMDEYKYLKEGPLSDLNIDVLHGKMKSKEKEEVMEKFRTGKINVLVSTTVIEIGIDIKNATIIAILHAERFGLAQLHQLRGRVIRSSHEPFCYALTDSISEKTRERLSVFEKNHDGFSLAEEDLKLRGGGELLGLKQSGMSDFAMEALKNKRLVEAAREAAKKVINDEGNEKYKNTMDELRRRESVHAE